VGARSAMPEFVGVVIAFKAAAFRGLSAVAVGRHRLWRMPAPHERLSGAWRALHAELTPYLPMARSCERDAIGMS
jgi:hypothetical protein